MYRFNGKLSPDADVKGLLRSFVLEQYASTPALDVPPEPAAFDWLVKAAQHKLAVVQRAIHEQVGPAQGCRECACPEP